ncbi:hypothetical protein D9M70_560600 [compost metagenome]
MPMDDSGSKAAAASPAAAQPSPQLGSSHCEWAGQTRSGSSASRQPRRARVWGAWSRAACQKAIRLAWFSCSRSESVISTETTRPSGTGALYHQPWGTDSTREQASMVAPEASW